VGHSNYLCHFLHCPGPQRSFQPASVHSTAYLLGLSRSSRVMVHLVVLSVAVRLCPLSRCPGYHFFHTQLDGICRFVCSPVSSTTQFSFGSPAACGPNPQHWDTRNIARVAHGSTCCFRTVYSVFRCISTSKDA
jgi:hypothetical protein